MYCKPAQFGHCPQFCRIENKGKSDIIILKVILEFYVIVWSDILESLINQIISALNGFFSSEMIAFLISMMPILELRGGLLAAKSFLNIDWQPAFVICVIGNLLPIPFVLLFIKKIFAWLKNTRLVKAIDRFEQRLKKKSESVLKYETFGLYLLVAVPLPGTGAWTGAMIASFLEMPFKNAMFSICLGVLTAGIIMALLSYGVLGFFF